MSWFVVAVPFNWS